MEQLINAKLNVYYLVILCFFAGSYFSNNELKANSSNPSLACSTYYANVHIAENYSLAKKYAEAHKFYQLAFETGICLSEDLRNALSTNLLSNKVDSVFVVNALQRLRASCDSSYFFNRIINSRLNYLLDKKLPSTLETALANVKPTYNAEIRKQVGLIFHNYQKSIKDECHINYGDSHPIGKIKITKQDSINQLRVTQLFTKYPNLSEWDVGIDLFHSTIELVALHNSEWTQYKLLPIIEELVHKGLYSNRIYAELYDRNSTENNVKTDKVEGLYGMDKGFIVKNKFVIIVEDEETTKRILDSRKELYLTDYLTYFRNKAKSISDFKPYLSIGGLTNDFSPFFKSYQEFAMKAKKNGQEIESYTIK